jgi:hypothetical protein
MSRIQLSINVSDFDAAGLATDSRRGTECCCARQHIETP